MAPISADFHLFALGGVKPETSEGKKNISLFLKKKYRGKMGAFHNKNI